MFDKILIANRGEIALRIMRACREMGIACVAVHSSADAESLHVKYADESVCVGKRLSSESYLNIPNIIAAAEITGADAIHPGYGFLAENAEFAEICAENHFAWIGPPAEVIRRMGDKAQARETAEKAGVPTVPGSPGLIETVEDAVEYAAGIGYPVIVKATAGGGGKGMRVATDPEDLRKQYIAARTEAGASFGNDGVYVERYLTNPRHIEIQLLGDKHGTIVHLGERECSLQRQNQKLDKLLKIVFGTTAISRMRFYTEKENLKFSKKMLGGFIYIKPLNYIKAFLLDYFKRDIKSLIDLLLIRGRWSTNLMSQQLSESFYSLMEVSDELLEFDESLSEEGNRGPRIRQYITRSEKDKNAMVSLRKVLKEINDEALSIIQITAQNLITIGKSLKQVLDDYEKRPHELLTNWKEIEQHADKDIHAGITDIYKRIYYFIQLLQYYVKKSG